MTAPFHSLVEFVHMGGYGFFVWVSYGTVACALALAAGIAQRRFNKTRQNTDARTS